MRAIAWVLVGLLAACKTAPSSRAEAEAEPASPGSPTTAGASGSSAASSEEAEDAPLRLEILAPGIIAAFQPESRRFADSNAVIVVNEGGALIVDGPQSLAATRWLSAQADARTDAARRILVTTHWHLDHSLGGAQLRERYEAEGHAVQHWGHAALDGLLAERGKQQRQEHLDALAAMITRGTAMRESGQHDDGTPLSAAQRAQLEEELAAIREQAEAVDALPLRPPTDHVEEITRFELGSEPIELHPMRAHTDADLVVYLPRAKVLITGDVLDEIPFAGHGRPRRWLGALERLSMLDVETIVPGHGSRMDRKALALGIAMWKALLEQAWLAVQHGETAAERYAQWEATPNHAKLRALLVSDPVSERAFDQFMPEALARAVADTRGEL